MLDNLRLLRTNIVRTQMIIIRTQDVSRATADHIARSRDAVIGAIKVLHDHPLPDTFLGGGHPTPASSIGRLSAASLSSTTPHKRSMFATRKRERI
jgi:hypothetical protein